MSDPARMLLASQAFVRSVASDIACLGKQPGVGGAKGGVGLLIGGNAIPPTPTKGARMKELKIISKACAIVEFNAAVDSIVGDTPTYWPAIVAASA